MLGEDDKFTVGVLKSLIKSNRNTGLFVKKKRPRKDSAAVRAEKDRLVQEFLATHKVTRIGAAFSQWQDGEMAVWQSEPS